jgi:hypothetical protein
LEAGTSYSRFRGAPVVTETVYEYERGVLVRAVATAEAEWTDTDRGLVLALLAERADTCPSCGHPMSQCRDASTAGSWTVVQEVCQPGRIAQAVSEDLASSKRRGVMLATRRTGGAHAR